LPIETIQPDPTFLYTCFVYQALFREVVSDNELLEISAHLQLQNALGPDTFRALVEAQTQRFAGMRPAHRPSRHK
jgi:putative transposase